MTTCYRCGGEYRQVYRNGRFQNLDRGTDRPHWQTCAGRGPNRQRVRALRKQTNHQSAAPIAGKHYRPSCADCTSLPWEPCQCWPAMPAVEICVADERLQLALWKDAA